MRELKINRVYKHFKGKEYVVLGISEPSEKNPYSSRLFRLFFTNWFEAELTEFKNCKINVFNDDGVFCHWKELQNDKL